MVSKKEENIFRIGSKTYYNASKFFPQPYKDDVFTLYAYVRVADDLVDAIPPKKEEFLTFRKETFRALKTTKSEVSIIKNFARLAQRKKFLTKDIRAFLDAMQSDIAPQPFKNFKDVDTYIYGSAEVIGLFMARIFNLPKELDEQARLLGKGMQYINWLRDIAQDNELGRTYLPRSVLKKHGLRSLEFKEAHTKPKAFIALMHEELDRQEAWQRQAATSFPKLPRCMRVPVMTATDAYLWTAKKIRKNPFIVFKKKVKPSKSLLLWFMLKNKVKSWTSKRC